MRSGCAENNILEIYLGWMSVNLGELAFLCVGGKWRRWITSELYENPPPHLFLKKFYLFMAVLGPVVMYGCESWTVKKAERWRIDVFELWCSRRLFESPLDCKEIQPVHPKRVQSWVFFGRTDAKAETPILWPPHAKSWLIGKDSDAGEGLGVLAAKPRSACSLLDSTAWQWHPTPVLLPGKSHGQRSLVGCSPGGR